MTLRDECCHGGKIRSVTFKHFIFSRDYTISITLDHD